MPLAQTRCSYGGTLQRARNEHSGRNETGAACKGSQQCASSLVAGLLVEYAREPALVHVLDAFCGHCGISVQGVPA